MKLSDRAHLVVAVGCVVWHPAEDELAQPQPPAWQQTTGLSVCTGASAIGMLCCFGSRTDIIIVLSRLYKAIEGNRRQHMAAPVPATTCGKDLSGKATAYGS